MILEKKAHTMPSSNIELASITIAPPACPKGSAILSVYLSAALPLPFKVGK